MVPLSSGPFLAAAVLLVVGGAAKVVSPDATARALASVGLPPWRATVRLVAGAEVAVGATAVVTGSRLSALLVASSYAAFSAFVVLVMARGGVMGSCGCFGTPDTPPTLSHLFVTVAAAGVAAVHAAGPAGPVLEELGRQPSWGLPFLAFTALTTWFAYLALAVLPTLKADAARSAG